jgi:arylsulfatase A-like enzyme
MRTQWPNILLIVADCARSDHWLGPDRRTTTPNLDRLAAGGASFPITIVEKACTTPSFATLLTGLYSPRHGVHLVWGYRLPEQVPLLTDALAARGYHTYAEVTGPLLAEMGLDRGFAMYTYRAPCDYLHTAWGDRFIERLRTGYYRAPWFILLHLWELHPKRQVAPEFDDARFGASAYERAVSSLDQQLGRVFAAAGDSTFIVFTGDHGEKTADERYRPGTAVDYARQLLGLDAADGMVPFDVAQWAGPSVLHELYGRCTPAMRRVRLRNMGDRRLGRSRPGRPGGRPPNLGDRRPRRSLRGIVASPLRFGARLRDRLHLLRLMPMVFVQDLLALGAPLRLTRMLEKRGLLDAARARRKVERFTRALGDQRLLDLHMRMWINSYKRNLDEGHIIHVYDFLVRVPLVLRWPGQVTDGAAPARMVRQPDILPTILDLLGANRDELGDIDGRSFKPLIENRPWEPEPAFLSVSGTPADLEIRGVRTEDYKYTFGPENDELPQELYDLRADPGETYNLADQNPGLCAELRALANQFVPADGESPLEELALTDDEQRRVAKHLQELGYIE